ncbi:MAG: S-layer homology domain-containing protein, partial [Anaerovorax sp.]
KIVLYDNQWYSTVKFPEISKAATSLKAFDAAVLNSGFDKKYIRTGNKEFVLAYGFTKQVDYLLDSVSCEKLNYNGEKYAEDGTSQYTDTAGKWYESTVNALLDNGYYLAGDTFNGGKSITQESFLRYLYSPTQKYSATTDDFYDMMKNNGIIEEDEIVAAGQVTRQDAAKFVTRYLGQDMVAKHAEVFKDVFKDKVDAEYKGYAAVAKSLGIMQGDSKGRFNGAAKLTNAQAAVVIYNTLNLE